MWRVQLYKFIHKHSKLGNLLRKFYISRKLMPLFFDFKNNYSDRRHMTAEILPALAASQARRVLFVGCREYTARYGKQLRRAGIDYWTTDVEPAVAMWGEKGHHITCDIAKIDDVCAPESFNAVLLNGVLGHGVDEVDQMNRSIQAISRILGPNGILLIGWNTRKKHPDPTELEAATMYFRREQVLSLPLRKTFPDTDHVYDWLVKR